MKKILYCKFTKWILSVVLILLIGNMLFMSYEMLVSRNKYGSECAEIYERDEKLRVELDRNMEMQFDEAFLYVLKVYGTSGIDGVMQLYNGEAEDYVDVLGTDTAELLENTYILIGDADQIYSNFVDVENTNIEDNALFIEKYHENRQEGKIEYTTHFMSQYTIHSDERFIRYGVVYDYWDDMIMDGDESLIETLREIDYMDLVIRLFVSHDYTHWFYDDISSETYYELENLEKDYKKEIKNTAIELIIPTVCLVVILITLTIIYGKSVDGLTPLNKWESKAAELHILAVVALCIPIIALIMYIQPHMYYLEDTRWIKPFLNKGAGWACIIGGTAIISGVIYEIGIFIKKRKNKRILKDCVILQFIIKVVKGIVGYLKKVYDRSAYAAAPDITKKYIRKVIMDVVVVVLTVLLMLSITESSVFSYLFMIAGISIYYVNSFIEYKDLRKYNKVVKAIETIYEGNYNSFTVENNEKNMALKMLAHLSDNFEESVRKQVEAEKMQIDLVANVSHDLKTPLTSIISYVELLKEEEMSDVAKDYVKVLADKSDRLKYIVADVFDLAKATSGEEVPMEQLDGVVLINQVLSDLHDKIEASGRELRVKITPEAAPLTGNGQKLYRVFQNIIDNALKYSMPGTRIYLAADMDGSEFVVALKNVSEYEMDFTAEEIMSRFTRGDKSRHSEGNGLGLSIAKSFTELMGGTFTVEIDDDVFKTIVRLR